MKSAFFLEIDNCFGAMPSYRLVQSSVQFFTEDNVDFVP